MKLVIIKSDKNDNPIITFEELTKLLNEAYDAGYKDGFNSVKVNPVYCPNWWCTPVTTTLFSNSQNGSETAYTIEHTITTTTEERTL